MIRISDVIRSIDGQGTNCSENLEIISISTDTRSIKEGELFIALKGESFDGHDFIGKAIQNGAKAIIYSKENMGISSSNYKDICFIKVLDTIKALGDLANWWRNKTNPYVIAITGSTGKTSTKEILASILSRAGKTHYTKGNLNNLIGVPLTLLRIGENDKFSVIEMGMSRSGEIRRLAEIADPDLGVITNVGPAHLEAFGSLEGVIRAKLELMEAMRPKCITLLDGDNQGLVREAERLKRPFLKVGTDSSNDYVLRIIEKGQRSVFELRINDSKKSYTFTIGTQVYAHIRNAATACSASIIMGIEDHVIQDGLDSFSCVKRRFQIIKLADNSYLVDDSYNSNPVSLEAGLKSLRDIFDGYKIVLCIGEMLELGEESQVFHKKAGSLCANCDPYKLIVIGDCSDIVCDAASKEGLDKARIIRPKSIEEAILIVKELISEKTVIYFKGSNRTGVYKIVDRILEDFQINGG